MKNTKNIEITLEVNDVPFCQQFDFSKTFLGQIEVFNGDIIIHYCHRGHVDICLLKCPDG